MNHILTFDVEDWFQVFYGERLVKKAEWENYPTKFPEMVDTLVCLTESKGIKATFFIVGWLADKYPFLIRKLHEAGHEIASHGYWHTEAYNLDEKGFVEDTKRSKQAIENAISDEISGYRAPGYSINPQMHWTLDIIKDTGFKYDSSLLHYRNGIHELENRLIEVAPNSIKVFSKFLPVNGGFVFRAVPWWLFDSYIQYLQFRSISLNFYTHSWEIINTDKKLALSGLKRFIQYYNTSNVPGKIDKMLGKYDFTSLKDHLLHMGYGL